MERVRVMTPTTKGGVAVDGDDQAGDRASERASVAEDLVAQERRLREQQRR